MFLDFFIFLKICIYYFSMKHISSHFAVFRLNTMIYSVNLRIHSEYGGNMDQKIFKFRHFSRSGIYLSLINPFIPNAPFLYPLKTSENRKVFWCFQGMEKGCMGDKWVNCKNKIRFRDRPFSTYAKFFEKLTFLSLFIGKFCVRTKWMIP